MRAAILKSAGALGILLYFGLLLAADENIKHPAEVTSTQQLDFAPGGLIRVEDSSGDLYVEGWDQPRVQMTVTKFMPYEYESAHPDRGPMQLEAVKIVAERRSPTELAMSTNRPSHLGFVWRPTPETDTSQVRIETRVFVPRDTRLDIHHGVGLVSVTDVIGEIRAACHRGDLVVWLPEKGVYSIDARSQLGKVNSDFPGAAHSHFLVGQRFVSSNSKTSQQLHLRVGFGGITLKPVLPESKPFPAPGD